MTICLYKQIIEREIDNADSSKLSAFFCALYNYD